jgi:thiamine-phosphate pyrophosphorylase
VNDRIDLAMVLEADGVHLGQDDLPPAEARRLLGPDAIIGYSTHTVEQARKAMELPIDYLAFGPVFPTSTKERPDAVVGTEVLSEIAKLAGKLPLVAIGGINESNLERTLSSGATSAAIISGLLSDPDRIEETLRRMLSRHGKLTNSV